MRNKETPAETPVLPPFPTEAFNINVTLEDKTVEIIKVMAKGRVSALQISLYTMARWLPEKQSQIISIMAEKV